MPRLGHINLRMAGRVGGVGEVEEGALLACQLAKRYK